MRIEQNFHKAGNGTWTAGILGVNLKEFYFFDFKTRKMFNS